MGIEDIPVRVEGDGVAAAGAEEPEIDYPVLPADMATYDPPDLAAWDDALDQCPQAVERLREIRAAVRGFATGGPQFVDLGDLDPVSLGLVNDALGEGEVSVRIDGERSYRIQESVLAGLWRVRRVDANEQVLADEVIVDTIPTVVRSTVAAETEARLSPEPVEPDAVNSRALRVELADRVARYTPGEPAHVINLTLLPMMPADQADLEHIGRGPVTILSRGYGNCRITATAARYLWRVQYFNSTDQLILDTLEVVDVPEVALAAGEDIAESAERLEQLLGQLQ